MFGNETYPVNRLARLRRDMDRLIDVFGSGLTLAGGSRAGTYPAMNVWDDGEVLRVEVEVPGVRLEDLEILALGNELTIRGRREAPEGNWTRHRQERGTGPFTRSLTLPCDIDADRVEAVLRAGVLMLQLPKAESARPQQITVKAE